MSRASKKISKVRSQRKAGEKTGAPARAERHGANGIIEFQRSVGNLAVQHLLQRTKPRPSLPIRDFPARVDRLPLLDAAQESAAIGYHNSRYTSLSTRVIQLIVGSGVTGTFDGSAAEAVAGFQDSNPGLVVDGKVGPNTLNIMVPNRVAADSHEHAIQIVADFYNLDITSGTLSVHFDAGLAAAFDTNFESGNLRVIRLGPTAFASADTLRAAIRNGLAVPAPVEIIIGDRPELLTTEEEVAAAAFNQATYTDRRSRLAIQGLVGTRADSFFGPDTAERTAEFQTLHGLTADGQVNEATLRVMVAELETTGQQNAAIRLIMDFYDMSDYDALLDISFDATVTSNASTSGFIPGPSVVRIGPAGFTQGYEGLVHTIAHELEHVRQRKVGIPSSNVREFLGEAIEIMSVGMPEEGLEGFFDDAGRALNRFEAMTDDEKRENWGRFEEVRGQVRRRFDAASSAEQATHQDTMDGYDAVTEPAAGP